MIGCGGSMARRWSHSAVVLSLVMLGWEGGCGVVVARGEAGIGRLRRGLGGRRFPMGRLVAAALGDCPTLWRASQSFGRERAGVRSVAVGRPLAAVPLARLFPVASGRGVGGRRAPRWSFGRLGSACARSSSLVGSVGYRLISSWSLAVSVTTILARCLTRPELVRAPGPSAWIIRSLEYLSPPT